jgi:hypothetical protein
MNGGYLSDKTLTNSSLQTRVTSPVFTCFHGWNYQPDAQHPGFSRGFAWCPATWNSHISTTLLGKLSFIGPYLTAIPVSHQNHLDGCHEPDA